MLRVVGPCFGVVLLGVVVWLGFRSAEDSGYVVWFGIASAILAPAGFAAIGLAFRGKDQRVLQELSSVPQIQELVAKADSEQERLQLLEEERRRLAEIVRVEARRQTLEERRELLLDDAARVLAALEALDDEAVALRLEMESSAVVPEVHELVQRLEARRQGMVILRFGKHDIAVDPDDWKGMPFGTGVFVMALLSWIETVQGRRGKSY